MIIVVKKYFSLLSCVYAPSNAENQSVTLGEAPAFQASYFLENQPDRNLRLRLLIETTNEDPLKVCIIAFEEKGNPATSVGEKSYFLRTSIFKLSYLQGTLKIQVSYIAYLQLIIDFFYFLTVFHDDGSKELSKVRSQPEL